MKATVKMGHATIHILTPDEGKDDMWQLLIEGIGDPLKATRGFSFPTYSSLERLLPTRLYDNVGYDIVDEHWSEVKEAMEALYKRYKAAVPGAR